MTDGLFDIFDVLFFHTSLEIPRLFDPKERYGRVTNNENVLEFEITYLSQTSEFYIPIRNLRGILIHVQLTNASSIMKQFSKFKGGSTTFISSKIPTDPADSRGQFLTGLGKVTPIGAAAAVGGALIGQHYNPDGLESSYLSSFDTKNAASNLPPFALGVQVSVYLMILPFELDSWA